MGAPGGSIVRLTTVTLLPIILPSHGLDRDVPEGISSGTWGQKDPAGSLLASDSVRRRKRETLLPKKLSGKDDLMGSTPMWRPGGWDGQTTEPQLVSKVEAS